MNNTPKLILFLLPVVFIVFAYSLKNATGPYHLNTRYDPSYVYLINSLNLSQLNGIGHFDHPGTTLQVTGAIAISINYLLNRKHSDIYTDVLSDPESYLNAIFILLTLINCFILYLCGILIFKWFNNIFLSILFQLIPFVSFTISCEFTAIASEGILIPVTLLMIIYSYKYSIEKYPGKVSYLILFSLFSGFALATKISFFPFLIIPLVLLKGLKNKLVYIPLTFISFLIFFSPSINNFGFFTEWIKMLFLNDGLYGKGKPVFIDPNSFAKNLQYIFANEFLFTLSYSVSILILLFVFFKKQKNNELISDKYKLLTAYIAAMTLQIVLVSKHYSGHYMVPSLMLSIPCLIICVTIYSKFPDSKFSDIKMNNFYRAITLLVLIFAIIQSYSEFQVLKFQRDEALKVNNFISENYSDAILISSYGSSSRDYALIFSTNWAASQKSRYRELINKTYPGKLYFTFWQKQIFSASEINSIKQQLHSGKRIIFQNSYRDSNADLKKELDSVYGFGNSEVVEVFKNANGESVYEIIKGK